MSSLRNRAAALTALGAGLRFEHRRLRKRRERGRGIGQQPGAQPHRHRKPQPFSSLFFAHCPAR